MTRPFFAIAGNTVTEVLRQPAYAIAVTVTIFAFAASPWLAMFSLGEDVNLLKDFGLSTLLLAGFVLACLASSAVVRREIELRTTLTLLAKPVARESFLVAKFLGVSGALVLAFYIFTVALLLAARQGPAVAARHGVDWPVLAAGPGAFALALLGAALANYLQGRSFFSVALYLAVCTSTGGFLLAAVFDRGWSVQSFASGFDPLLVKGAALAVLAIMVLAACAVSVSVWLGRGGTLGVTGALLVAGLSLDALARLSPIPAMLLPDFQLFWVGELFYQRARELPWPYLLDVSLYAAAYITVFMVAGCVGFRRKGL